MQHVGFRACLPVEESAQVNAQVDQVALFDADQSGIDPLVDEVEGLIDAGDHAPAGGLFRVDGLVDDRGGVALVGVVDPPVDPGVRVRGVILTVHVDADFVDAHAVDGGDAAAQGGDLLLEGAEGRVVAGDIDHHHPGLPGRPVDLHDALGLADAPVHAVLSGLSPQVGEDRLQCVGDGLCGQGRLDGDVAIKVAVHGRRTP